MSYLESLEEVKDLFRGILPNHIEIEVHKRDKIDCINLTGDTTILFEDDARENGYTKISLIQKNSIKFEIRVKGIEIINYDPLSKDRSFEFFFFMPDQEFGRINVMGEPNDNYINFDKLVKLAKDCTICESMLDKEAIIGYQNGNLNADILFIAEAPGPRGADKTGIPLTGDVTGKNFDEILEAVGLKRKDIFITNAVLCCPTDINGKVRKPKTNEIKNCSGYLAFLIELINPKVIVTLGSVALEALKQIEKHQLTLKSHIATFYHWNNRFIYPLYHPSPLVINTGLRSMKQQKTDYLQLVQNYEKRILKGLNPISLLKGTVGVTNNTIEDQVILRLGGEGGSISLYGKEHKGKWYFSLHTNEIALVDFLEDEELSHHLISKSLIVEGFHNGLRLLDEYPWVHLVPHDLHPLFADEIITEVKKRISNDKSRLYRWERAYEILKLRNS
ncbi:uracil-DNA glycosylase [Bacillus sp. ISL-18]|uniref:uracil-DNA glycosylase n=1 Tax=Bacillus sp. ISL-18 TaxID=2819118 RepID=UPI001BE6099F|nr:uracil-DNA glycosylase [Bacillus sp. ISL-18]MBT2655355.1 uracil-DNA glycosylase [Bacillus sp. ISL-18]